MVMQQILLNISSESQFSQFQIVLILFIRSMSENPVSIKTKNQNLLHSKTKTFRQNYSQSLERITVKSSIHTLAKSVYSQKNNQQFSPRKQRPPSAANPEHRSSSALKGLDMRVSHIPNMSDINTELLLEKRKLQERILALKQEIARETRFRNRADTNWKLLKNQKQETNQSYQQLCKKSLNLNIGNNGINDTKNECQQLRNQNQKLRQQNEEKTNSIAQQRKYVEIMTNKVNMLKNSLAQEQKQRNFVKGQLVKQQRVMDSFSIQAKQLQNQRAMVLLQINQSVLKNKL